MAAAVPPGGLGIPAPPAAGLPVAIPHIFIRCRLAATDDTLDYVRCDKQCKLVQAFPSLGWRDASVLGVNQVAAPALAIQFPTCIACFSTDWDGAPMAPLMASAELVSMFTLTRMGAGADALESLGVLAKVYTTTEAFLGALEVALPRLPTPSPFLLAGGEIVVPTPFLQGGSPAIAPIPAVAAVPAVVAVPAVRARRAGPAGPALVAVRGIPGRAAVGAVTAVPAVPAVPPSGPAALEWWNMVQLRRVVDTSAIFPFLDFCRRGLLALDRCSAAARDDPTSSVRAVAGMLANYASEGVAGVSPAGMARAFVRLAPRLFALPDELRSGSFDSMVLETELADDIEYGKGVVARQEMITSSRLMFARRAYPELLTLLDLAGSGAARASALMSLRPLLQPAEARQPLFGRLGPLNTLVLSHNAFLVQCYNKSLPLEGEHGILSLLIKERSEFTGNNRAATGGGGADELNDADLLGSGAYATVSTAAWRRALQEDPDFVAAAEEIARVDVSSEEGRLEALGIALLCKVNVFQRFFAKPVVLLHRHAVFGILYKCMGTLPTYFGHGQAADSNGEVAEAYTEWAYPEDQCALLFRGQVPNLTLFNGVGGALALFNLGASEPFLGCPDDQLYIVEAVLEMIITFTKATFISAGWDAASEHGYTMWALFERQLKHIKWIRGMGEGEINVLLPQAQLLMVDTLNVVKSNIVRKMSEPEPRDTALNYVLEFGTCNYDKVLTAKSKNAEPLVAIRRAFPSLMPVSTPRSLPGVTLPTPTKVVGGGGGGGGGGGRDVTPKDGPAKTKKEKEAQKKEDKKLKGKQPGGMKSFSEWTDDTHMRLGSFVYDIKAICDHYSLSIDEVCWPVLVSTKPIEAALCFCPRFGEAGHESKISSAHTRPKGWNAAEIEKKFSKAAVKSGDKRKGKA